jgi:hypothetical protein
MDPLERPGVYWMSMAGATNASCIAGGIMLVQNETLVRVQANGTGGAMRKLR